MVHALRLLLRFLFSRVISKSELENPHTHTRHRKSDLIFGGKISSRSLKHFCVLVARSGFNSRFAALSIVNNSQFQFPRCISSTAKIAIAQTNRGTCFRSRARVRRSFLKFQQITGRDAYRDQDDRGKTLPRWQVSLTTVTLSHCTAPGQEDPQSELPLGWASRLAT